MKPKLIASEVKPDTGAVGPGQTVKIKMTLSNVGTSDALNSKVTVRVTTPITIAGSGSIFYLGTIGAGSNRSITVVLSVDPQAHVGDYAVSYSIDYSDYFSGAYSEVGAFGISVGNIAVKPKLIASKIDLPSGTIGPGQTFKANMSIANVGTSDAINSIVSIQVTSPLSLVSSGSIFYLATVGTGTNRSIPLLFSVDPKGHVGNYIVDYNIGYTDVFGKAYNESGFFGVSVSNVAVKPKLIASKIDLPSGTIGPGQTFKANMSIANVGTSDAINSIVSIQVTSPLSLVSSGSIFYLGTIKSGSNVSISIALSVDPHALVGDNMVNYSLDYTDIFGGAYTDPGFFGVAVSDAAFSPNLLVSGVDMTPKTIIPGQPFDVTVLVSNVGTSAAIGSIVSIQVTSPLSLVGSSGSISLGNIDPKGNASIHATLFVGTDTSTGVFPAGYSLTFRDKLGKTYQATGTFNVRVQGSPNIKIKDIYQSGTNAIPGNPTTLLLRLLNAGTDRALDLTINLSGNSSIIPTDMFRYAGSILQGDTTNVTFSLNIPGDAAYGVYLVKIDLRYKDNLGNGYASSQTYDIRVQPPGQPIVSIRNVLYDPTVLTPEAQGTMTLFLTNTGSSQAKDVTVRISGDNGMLSSNTFYVGSIDTDAPETVVLGVSVGSNVLPGAYLLKAYISYTDTVGTRYNSSSFLELRLFPLVQILTPVNIGIIAGVVAIALLSIPTLKRWEWI